MLSHVREHWGLQCSVPINISYITRNFGTQALQEPPSSKSVSVQTPMPMSEFSYGHWVWVFLLACVFAAVAWQPAQSTVRCHDDGAFLQLQHSLHDCTLRWNTTNTSLATLENHYTGYAMTTSKLLKKCEDITESRHTCIRKKKHLQNCNHERQQHEMHREIGWYDPTTTTL